MKIIFAAALLGLTACSKGSPEKSAPATPPTAAPAAAAPAPASGGPQRLEAFMVVVPPTTAGNPNSINVCVTMYDDAGKPTAAEGQFDVDSGDLSLSAGAYVYKPMFTPIVFPDRASPTGTSPLGVCPASGGMWPDRQAQSRGKTFPVNVRFKLEDGRELTTATSLSL